MRRAACAVLWFFLFSGGLIAQQLSSITIDQASPYYAGESGITFTSVYPREARQGGRTPQFPLHPQLQINCTQGMPTSIFFTVVDPEGAGFRSNGDGTYTGHSSPPISLTSASWNPGLPATCGAALYNFTESKGHVSFTVYANLYFDVTAAP